MECPEEFTQFAAADDGAAAPDSFLLCGDWHGAEDLTQIALTKTLLAWRRIKLRRAVHAHRTLVNAYLGQRRSRKSGELPVDQLPEVAEQHGTAELRVVLIGALATLPPQARAVVVLRYWEDLSVEQAADILRCSAGNVKSQSARALQKLRDAARRQPGRADADRLTDHGILRRPIEMNETAIRDSAAADDGTARSRRSAGQIVGGAVRAAQHGPAGAQAGGRNHGVAAAIVPALAFGVPAIAGALAPAAPQHGVALAPGVLPPRPPGPWRPELGQVSALLTGCKRRGRFGPVGWVCR